MASEQDIKNQEKLNKLKQKEENINEKLLKFLKNSGKEGKGLLSTLSKISKQTKSNTDETQDWLSLLSDIHSQADNINFVKAAKSVDRVTSKIESLGNKLGHIGVVSSKRFNELNTQLLEAVK